MLPSGNNDGVGPNVQRHTYNLREILIVPVLTHDALGYVGSGHALARAAWRDSLERDVTIVPKAALNTQARTWSAAPTKGQVRRQHREDAETGFLDRSSGSTSPRFSRSRISGDSSALMIIGPSEPPMKCRRSGFVECGAAKRSLRLILIRCPRLFAEIEGCDTGTWPHGGRSVDKVPHNMYGRSL